MTTTLAPDEAQGAAMAILRPRCPDCGRTQLYYRKKTKDYACKSCPYTGKVKQEAKSSKERKK